VVPGPTLISRTCTVTVTDIRDDNDWTMKVSRLRRFNVSVGVLHAVQAATVLFLANSLTLSVTGTFLVGPPTGLAGPPTLLANMSVARGVALFSCCRPVSTWSYRLSRRRPRLGSLAVLFSDKITR
jgi:hypothetical protein